MATSATELWYSIPLYEGLYEASTLGRVRSVARTVKGRDGDKRLAGAVLAPRKVSGRYLQVTLFKGGKGSQRQIHRLVLQACVGDGPAGFHADHVDGDIENNALTNLQWCSPAENMQKRRSAKMTMAAVLRLREAVSGGADVRDAAASAGISERHAYQLVAKSRWSNV